MDIDPALAAYLDAYATAFDAITGLSTLCFGAGIFLFVRGVGVIIDEDVAHIRHNWLLLLVIVAASLSWILVVLAESQIASFYNDAFRRTAAHGCSFELTKPAAILMSDAAWYFENCNRPVLRWFIRIASITTLLATSGLILWLSLHVRSKRRA